METTTIGDTKTYDALLVANGHHWDPLWPDPPFPGSRVASGVALPVAALGRGRSAPPGKFSGKEMHAHHYKSMDELRGKRVVVVGMGNSAMDIAVEASEVGRAAYLSARRGVHVVPKYVFGKPLDQLGFISLKLPFKVKQKMGEVIHKLAVGDMTRYGLPKPDHRLGEAHPTISGRILDRLTHGAIVPKPNIEELEGDRVRFTDGTTVEADVIVYCTGYRVSFPFFDSTFLEAKDNVLPLFMRVFDPARPMLMFVGLLQPLGAIMPLAEAQGKWIAQYLRGEYALPPRAEMEKRIAEDERAMKARYVKSKRHTMQVDFDEYLDDLAKEIKRGRRRAERSFPLEEGSLPRSSAFPRK